MTKCFKKKIPTRLDLSTLNISNHSIYCHLRDIYSVNVKQKQHKCQANKKKSSNIVRPSESICRDSNLHEYLFINKIINNINARTAANAFPIPKNCFVFIMSNSCHLVCLTFDFFHDTRLHDKCQAKNDFFLRDKTHKKRNVFNFKIHMSNTQYNICNNYNYNNYKCNINNCKCNDYIKYT